MSGNEPVKYVTFGGARVPENTNREVLNQNGEKLYCVWTENGGKVTYPEQQTYPTDEFVYMNKTVPYYAGGQKKTSNISKFEFDSKANYIYNHPKTVIDNNIWGRKYKLETSTGYDSTQYTMQDNQNGDCNIRIENKLKTNRGDFYTGEVLSKTKRDTTPIIDIMTNEGIINNTQQICLSNINGAIVTGSSDEDNISLMNSSNCTVDVSKANNNMFVSDNVIVVNGQGNVVKSGDNDQVTFSAHDYNTNKTTYLKEEGNGTFKQ